MGYEGTPGHGDNDEAMPALARFADGRGLKTGNVLDRCRTAADLATEMVPRAFSTKRDKYPDLGGRYWDRTSDLLGVNQIPGIAGRCQAWPDVPFSWDDDCSLALGVAQCWWSLAPNLAPRESLSFANVR